MARRPRESLTRKNIGNREATITYVGVDNRRDSNVGCCLLQIVNWLQQRSRRWLHNGCDTVAVLWTPWPVDAAGMCGDGDGRVARWERDLAQWQRGGYTHDGDGVVVLGELVRLEWCLAAPEESVCGCD